MQIQIVPKVLRCLILCYLLTVVVGVGSVIAIQSILYPEATIALNTFEFGIISWFIFNAIAPANVLYMWMLYGLKIILPKYITMLYVVAETICYIVLLLSLDVWLEYLPKNDFVQIVAMVFGPFIPIFILTLLAKFVYRNYCRHKSFRASN